MSAIEEVVKSVAEIVAEAVAEGRATPDDSVADVLLREGYIQAFAWPREHAIDDHPGAAGDVTYLAVEPLRVSDSAGTARDLQPGDALAADEARASRTALHGLLQRHQIVALPSATGLVGLVSLLLAKVARLERGSALAALSDDEREPAA